jgi:hypothetical protein
MTRPDREEFIDIPVSVGELTTALDAYPPSKRVKVLYVREGNQVWEYRIVNVSEDFLGVNLIIESARKLMNDE